MIFPHLSKINTQANFRLILGFSPCNDKGNDMEMDTESRMDWLLRKQLLIFDFKTTFDGLVVDSLNILAEFVDCKSFDLTCTFN